MQKKFQNERDFIQYITTNGDEGHYLGDIITKDYTSHVIKRFAPWFLVEAILFGSLAKICSRCFEFDSMLTQMFRERTKFFLDLIPFDGLGTTKNQLNKLLESSKTPTKIPVILQRYCNNGIISFSNQIIDMEVSVNEVYELIREYHWLSVKICNN